MGSVCLRKLLWPSRHYGEMQEWRSHLRGVISTSLMTLRHSEYRDGVVGCSLVYKAYCSTVVCTKSFQCPFPPTSYSCCAMQCLSISMYFLMHAMSIVLEQVILSEYPLTGNGAKHYARHVRLILSIQLVQKLE